MAQVLQGVWFAQSQPLAAVHLVPSSVLRGCSCANLSEELDSHLSCQWAPHLTQLVFSCSIPNLNKLKKLQVTFFQLLVQTWIYQEALIALSSHMEPPGPTQLQNPHLIPRLWMPVQPVSWVGIDLDHFQSSPWSLLVLLLIRLPVRSLELIPHPLCLGHFNGLHY